MKNVFRLLMLILLVPCFIRVGIAMRSEPQQMGEAHWKALRLLSDFLDKVKQANGPTPVAPSRDTDKPFKQWLSEGLKTGRIILDPRLDDPNDTRNAEYDPEERVYSIAPSKLLAINADGRKLGQTALAEQRKLIIELALTLAHERVHSTQPLADFARGVPEIKTEQAAYEEGIRQGARWVDELQRLAVAAATPEERLLARQWLDAAMTSWLDYVRNVMNEQIPQGKCAPSTIFVGPAGLKGQIKDVYIAGFNLRTSLRAGLSAEKNAAAGEKPSSITTLVNLSKYFPKKEFAYYSKKSTEPDPGITAKFQIPGPGYLRVSSAYSAHLPAAKGGLQWNIGGGWAYGLGLGQSIESITQPRDLKEGQPVWTSSVVAISAATNSSLSVEAGMFPVTNRFGDGSGYQHPIAMALLVEYSTGPLKPGWPASFVLPKAESESPIPAAPVPTLEGTWRHEGNTLEFGSEGSTTGREILPDRSEYRLTDVKFDPVTREVSWIRNIKHKGFPDQMYRGKVSDDGQSVVGDVYWWGAHNNAKTSSFGAVRLKGTPGGQPPLSPPSAGTTAASIPSGGRSGTSIATSSDISGTWDTNIPGSVKVLLEFQRSGSGWSGRFMGRKGWEAMADLSFDPASGGLSFRRPLKSWGEPDQLYTAKVTGDSMSGNMDNQAAWNGTRRKGTGTTAVSTDPPQTARLVNVARGKPAVQSSTAYGGSAGRAVDGNTDGGYFAGNSITHTAEDNPQPWWQVDLGASFQIDHVMLWNRRDCCGERLASFRLFVSDSPFPAGDISALTRDGRVWRYEFTGVAGPQTRIEVGRQGRYLRIQLSGPGPLSLAEVEVLAR